MEFGAGVTWPDCFENYHRFLLSLGYIIPAGYWESNEEVVSGKEEAEEE
jgi:hypothetical protein